jgi:hypothetical protein
MQIEDNDASGKTIILIAGDDLKKVPKSHRRLITPSLADAFADPPACFKAIAKRCRFPAMARWLRALLTANQWALHLNQGDPKRWTLAGFNWSSDEVRGATLALPSEPDLSDYPSALKKYYSLVDTVQWITFGRAGSLDGAGGTTPMTTFAFNKQETAVDPATAYAWGWSPCGDILFYTADGRGGWFCHENGHFHVLGTVAETIEWVYSELLANRCPEYDYNWS